MKKRTILIIIAFLLIIIPYFINTYSYLRLSSYILGLVLLAVLIFKYNKSFFTTIIVLITIFVSSCFIDFILCYKKHIPFISAEVISAKNVKTYYSIFYQINICYDNWNVDKFYQKGYSCEKDDLKKTSVNDFLNVYESNKKRYIRVKGKISQIVGEKYIELKPYEEDGITINGTVNFKEDIVLRLSINNNDIDVKKLKIYDEIEFIGRVDKKIKENELNIYLFKDVQLYQTDLYENFEIIVNTDDKCELDKTMLVEINEIKYYTSCLKDINIRFDENNIYDLDYVLMDEKINLKDLLKLNLENIKDANNNTLYKLDKLNILVCSNKDVILGKNILLENGYCEVADETGV